MRLYRPLPYDDYPLQPFRQIESAEGQDVSGGGESRRRPTDTVYSTRRDVDEQSSLVDIDDWLGRLGKEDEVGNWTLIVWLNH